MGRNLRNPKPVICQTLRNIESVSKTKAAKAVLNLSENVINPWRAWCTTPQWKGTKIMILEETTSVSISIFNFHINFRTRKQPTFRHKAINSWSSPKLKDKTGKPLTLTFIRAYARIVGPLTIGDTDSVAVSLLKAPPSAQGKVAAAGRESCLACRRFGFRHQYFYCHCLHTVWHFNKHIVLYTMIHKHYT